MASQPKWGKHRRVINKAFHRKALDSYRSKIVESCKAFTDKLEGYNCNPIFPFFKVLALFTRIEAASYVSIRSHESNNDAMVLDTLK